VQKWGVRACGWAPHTTAAAAAKRENVNFANNDLPFSSVQSALHGGRAGVVCYDTATKDEVVPTKLMSF
jgi:hypothetical protein